jgi:hypothetical protein
MVMVVALSEAEAGIRGSSILVLSFVKHGVHPANSFEGGGGMRYL